MVCVCGRGCVWEFLSWCIGASVLVGVCVCMHVHVHVWCVCGGMRGCAVVLMRVIVRAFALRVVFDGTCCSVCVCAHVGEVCVDVWVALMCVCDTVSLCGHILGGECLCVCVPLRCCVDVCMILW